jgi:SynChlorMet cassette protein ScmD
MIESNRTPTQNSDVVFREESDNWAIIFDPNSGETYGLDSISIAIWKKLNGKNSMQDIVNELTKECIDEVPEHAIQDISFFVNDLVKKGLAYIQ